MNEHPVHPFHSVAEAQQHASAFLRACQFYSLKYVEPNGAPGELGLQRVHTLIALLFGYRQWTDLTSSISPECRAPYFDADGSAEVQHRKFADRVMPRLIHPDMGRIYWALRTSGFGCTPERRKLGCQMMDLYPCETIEQWRKLETLRMGYRYMSRYNNRRSAHEIEMLEWTYRKDVAEIMGTPVPRKPRRTKLERER